MSDFTLKRMVDVMDEYEIVTDLFKQRQEYLAPYQAEQDETEEDPFELARPPSF